MAAVCQICGKKPFFGKAVTFSHKRNNRRWNPNIQKVRALVDAVRAGKAFVTEAIRHSLAIGNGIGPVDQLWSIQPGSAG